MTPARPQTPAEALQHVQRGVEGPYFRARRIPCGAPCRSRTAPRAHRAVAPLHCAPRMDEDEHSPIPPPPPSPRVALWAMLNALWFRHIHLCWCRYRGAVRAVPRSILSTMGLRPAESGPARYPGLLGPAPRPTGSITRLAREGRLSSLMGRLARGRTQRATERMCPRVQRDDRPTAVDVRRAPPMPAPCAGARGTPAAPRASRGSGSPRNDKGLADLDVRGDSMVRQSRAAHEHPCLPGRWM